MAVKHNARVQFNEFFDQIPGYAVSIEERINYAFKNDGKDFWKNFFPCNNRGDRQEIIIYLFTGQQVAFLRKWWDKNTQQKGTIKDNLEESINFFHKRPGFYPNNIREPIFVCYMTDIDYEPKFRRLLFGTASGIGDSDRYVDFFTEQRLDEMFKQEVYTGAGIEPKREGILRALPGKLKKKIKELFDESHLALIETEWLLYLGRNYHGCPSIKYCQTITPKCHMAEKIIKKLDLRC